MADGTSFPNGPLPIRHGAFCAQKGPGFDSFSQTRKKRPDFLWKITESAKALYTSILVC